MIILIIASEHIVFDHKLSLFQKLFGFISECLFECASIARLEAGKRDAFDKTQTHHDRFEHLVFFGQRDIFLHQRIFQVFFERLCIVIAAVHDLAAGAA